ncbi:hypothetical protein AB1F87_003404 [Vibrio mimicus]
MLKPPMTIMLCGLVVTLMVTMGAVFTDLAEADERKTIRFSAPPVAQAVPLLRVVEDEKFHTSNMTAEFIPWRSPEQLHVLIANGEVDTVIAALPTAAVLYNKGIPCSVVAVYSAPLWIVAADSATPEKQGGAVLQSFTMLHDQEILLPFGPGNMPELALRVLADQSDVNLKIRYSGSVMEAANLLRRGQAAYALLPEPAATLVTMRNSQTTRIRKDFSLTKVWSEVFTDQPAMATAALIMVGPLSQDSSARVWVRKSFMDGAAWSEANPEAALLLAMTKYPEMGQQLRSSVENGEEVFRSLGLLDRQEGDTAARFMLEKIFALNPASVGGRLPDENIWGFDHAAP